MKINLQWLWKLAFAVIGGGAGVSSIAVVWILNVPQKFMC